MSPSTVAWLLGLSLVPGPAYVKVESSEARGCPSRSCASAGPVAAGEVYRIQELRDGWARFMAPNGSLTAWVPAEALASGSPAMHRARTDLALLACLEPRCRVRATIPAGTDVPVLHVQDGAASVLYAGTFGWVKDAAALESKLLPAAPPAYVPPADAPVYIPPAQAPRYIPSESTAVYVPPVPASGAAADSRVRFVREPVADLREGPSATSAVRRQAPGGAKVALKESRGDWALVRLGESEGWILSGALGTAAPRLATVAADVPGARGCPDDSRCTPEGPAISAGSDVVIIDEPAGSGWVLAVLPGSPRGWGWLPASAVAPPR